MQKPAGSMKKHKKHKKEKHEEKSLNGDRPTALKLILKVGSSSTPEHSDSPGPIPSNYAVTGDDESLQSSSSLHKKAKKKKKKKDREHEKHEKKRKHHHKDRKRRYDDQSSEDGMSIGEESMIEPPSALEYCNQPKQDMAAQNESQTSGREPRLCVQLLRQKQNRSPLIKTLEYLQRQLEMKDPQQFFAWPVTDQIAPGYSKTITHPMDFSTMRQKIEDNAYSSLNEYITDLKLMCNNAMTYNQSDTIYYKAAKRLLHGGLKLLSPEKMKQLSTSLKWVNEIPPEQLGFQIRTGHPVHEIQSAPSPKKVDTTDDNSNSANKSPKRKMSSNVPESKFEAIPDDLTPEQILEQSQKALKITEEKLSLKKRKTNMGFLRQRPDGSTSLAILIPGSNNSDNPQEKPISLGQLIGKISHGSGQLQGMREDRRSFAKTVRPLNYGAFGSYAPSYDSTFANLSKEESDLIYETYGDENATLYAESVLNFAKDCDYTLNMVDNLLDLLTGGEHRKAIAVIDEQRKYREEEERVRDLMESKEVPSVNETNGQTDRKSDCNNVKIEIEQLKTLSDLGIDISFLNDIDGDVTESSPTQPNPVQDKLEHTTALIEKLQQVQNDRLSSPAPTHLGHILPPSETEINLAEKITESLTELAKQVPPGALIPVPAIRKAMGIVNETMSVSTSTNTTSPLPNSVGNVVVLDGDDSSGEEEPCVGVGQLDLESELREFLESDTALSNFPLHDDKTIEEMLSES
uniref:Bromo domain-containing protein n=1 Tax=Lygus hesperus TaxID=30085 RepID=A0A0K8SQJ5_LYGHE